MFLIFILLLLSALSTYLLTLINFESFYQLFYYIPLGILAGLILFILLVVLYFYIESHTDPKGKLKHFIMHQALSLFVKFYRIKLIVVGYENVPTNDTFTIYANHKSNLDPVLLYTALKTKCTAVGKKSLFQNWFLRLVAKTFNALPIDRENDREAAKSIAQAIKVVKNGLPCMIFPEGGIKSRDTEDMVNLKAGAYKLAMKSNSKLLPVSIVGSSEISKKKIYQKKIIKIIIHKPLEFNDYKSMNTTELGMYVEQIINNGVHEYSNK